MDAFRDEAVSRQASSMLTLTCLKFLFMSSFEDGTRYPVSTALFVTEVTILFSYLGNLLAIKVLSCLISVIAKCSQSLTHSPCCL